jgi:hypothetical protein
MTTPNPNLIEILYNVLAEDMGLPHIQQSTNQVEIFIQCGENNWKKYVNRSNNMNGLPLQQIKFLS